MLIKQLGIVVLERNSILDPSKYHAFSDSYDGAPDATGKHSVIGYGDTEEEAASDLLEIWKEIAEKEGLAEALRTARRKEKKREGRAASLQPGAPIGKSELEDLNAAIDDQIFQSE